MITCLADMDPSTNTVSTYSLHHLIASCSIKLKLTKDTNDAVDSCDETHLYHQGE